MEVLSTHEAHRRKSSGYHQAQARMHTFTTLMVHVCAGCEEAPSTTAAARGSSASGKPLPAPPPLALLIASHVPDHERLRRLRACLRCVGAQRGDQLKGTWLSWSAGEALRPAVRKLIEELAVPRLHAVEQPQPLRQFEHYADISRRASEALGEAAWAIFSDDDDLMHPERSSAYAAAITEAIARGARAVGAAWTARPRVAESPRTASDVDALVAAGRVVSTPELDEHGKRLRPHDAWDEYFNYGVELCELRRFFSSACPEAVRRSTYADMVLHTYLRNAVPTARFDPSLHGFGSNWAYYYDKPIDLEQAAAQGNASSGVTPIEADAAAAVALKLVGGLEQVSEAARMHLAAQERSLYELYCTCFAGSPKPTPLKSFLLLGQLVAMDHLENLGHDRKVAEAVAGGSARKLARTAKAFGVVTEPALPALDEPQRVVSIN